MQDDQNEKRTPEEIEALAKETMRRMLSTPPTPHVAKKAKKSKSPKK